MTTRVPPTMIGVGAGESIQSAINSLPSNGGIVKLGPGTHTISTALVIRSGVILEGEGSQATTVSYTGAAQALVQSTPGTRIYGVGLRGIKFSDAGTGNPITLQIETGRASGSFVKGVRAGTTYFEAYASGALGIADGITAPATVAGMAQIYVDTADGDLKVKFGDGVVKTIVLDT